LAASKDWWRVWVGQPWLTAVRSIALMVRVQGAAELPRLLPATATRTRSKLAAGALDALLTAPLPVC